MVPIAGKIEAVHRFSRQTIAQSFSSFIRASALRPAAHSSFRCGWSPLEKPIEQTCPLWENCFAVASRQQTFATFVDDSPP